ncbi:MAG TPA: metallophosphoesterase family protein [bacterium]
MTRKPAIATLCFVGLFVPSRLLTQTITNGPYLADPGRSSMTIRWETDKLADGSVYWREDGREWQSQSAQLISEKNGFYLYETRLLNLQSGSEYLYEVKLGANTNTLTSHFRTAMNDLTPMSFVAMGDSRSNPDIFRLVAERVNQVSPDLIISNGDLVENGGDFEQWQAFYFSAASAIIDHIPLLSCLGDHEGDGDNGELFRYFLYPGLPVNELWFSFDYGPAHFVALDYRHPNNKKMIEWFEEDLANAHAKWKFVYMHRPCYNTGGHRSNWGSEAWPALFQKHKIDIVFAGHSHLYERFFPMCPTSSPQSRPVTYVTTAGAGAGLYDAVAHPFLAVTESVNHFVYVQVQEDTLRYRAYRNDGSLLDQFAFIKHDEQLDADYLSLVRPQEVMDVYAMFASAISGSVTTVPLFSQPAEKTVSLQLRPAAGDIEFEISLTNESSGHFKMAPATGILRAGQPLELSLQIFSKSDLTISGWGDIEPVLQLQATYKCKLGEGAAVGKIIDYWPD